jgi:hypothetical protein
MEPMSAMPAGEPPACGADQLSGHVVAASYQAIVEADAVLTHPGHHVRLGVAGGSGCG